MFTSDAACGPIAETEKRLTNTEMVSKEFLEDIQQPYDRKLGLIRDCVPTIAQQLLNPKNFTTCTVLLLS
jgi:hypothetical protein